MTRHYKLRRRSWRNSRYRYGLVAQALHWGIAVLVAVQFGLGLYGAGLPPLSFERLAVLARHKSVGLTVLILAMLRLVWRRGDRPPPLPASVSGVERGLARIAHALLYSEVRNKGNKGGVSWSHVP